MSPAEELTAHFNEAMLGAPGARMIELLAEASGRRTATWFGHPICRVLRPFFIDQADHRRHRLAAEGVLSAIGTAFEAIRKSDELSAMMGLPPRRLAMMQFEREYESVRGLRGRIDGFVGRDGVIRFVEYNSSPAGLVLGSNLAEVMLEHPDLASKPLGCELHHVDTRRTALDALEEAAVAFNPAHEDARVAVIVVPDERRAPPANEGVDFETDHMYRALSERFEGIPIDTAEHFSWNGTNLIHDRAGPVEVVFVESIPDMLLTYGFDQPLLHALAARAIRINNGLAWSFITASKATWAVMSDPRFESLFSTAERASISRHVPWTRLVEEAKTTVGDAEVDLLDHALRQREALVLKPVDGEGGDGVVLGWEADNDTWEAAVRNALEGERAYVLQDRVDIPRETFPVFDDAGKVELVELACDYNPYVWNSERCEGSLVRVSSGDLLNVTAGAGSLAPVFVVE